MSSATDDDPLVAEVRRANDAFYAAFEARDLEAMSDLWERSGDVSLVHPGWPVLVGWPKVSASWFALFDGPQRLQFIVTDVRARVEGDVGIVTCNENLLDSGGTQTVAATNVFVRRPPGWLLIHHHGSAVARQQRQRNS